MQARFLGLEDAGGGLRPGAPADVVLLDGDPLAEISAVRSVAAVVVRGYLLEL